MFEPKSLAAGGIGTTSQTFFLTLDHQIFAFRVSVPNFSSMCLSTNDQSSPLRWSSLQHELSSLATQHVESYL